MVSKTLGMGGCYGGYIKKVNSIRGVTLTKNGNLHTDKPERLQYTHKSNVIVK